MNNFALTTLTLLAFLCAPCAAYPTAQGDVSEIPFTLEKGHIIVQASSPSWWN